MCKAIRTPESQQDTVTPEALHYLTPGKELSAKERLAIYVDDYWARCINSLTEDFPGLQHVLGHEKFHALVEKYLVKHPSKSYTLRNLGDKLLDFMTAEYKDADKAMCLDMVRFEWAKIEAFDNTVLPPFDPLKLTKAQRDNLLYASFIFQPHLSLLRLEYPVYEVVDALLSKEKKAIPAPQKRESFTVVYRRDLVVYHKEVEKPYFLLLEQLKHGLALSDACEAILPVLNESQIKKLERKVTSWFQDCVANKWLSALK